MFASRHFYRLDDVTIVAANSSGLKELLALKLATDACTYYLYGAPVVNVLSDCSALEGMFSKP